MAIVIHKNLQSKKKSLKTYSILNNIIVVFLEILDTLTYSRKWNDHGKFKSGGEGMSRE